MIVDTSDVEFDTLDVSHREDGWQKRFIYLVDAELSKPFHWQYAHCADLMACSVYACYGTTHPILQNLENRTGSDKLATLKRLADLGGFESLLGDYFAEVPISHAFQADIALYKNADGSIAGAIVCDGQLVGRRYEEGKSAAFRLPLSKAYKIYRV